MMKYDVIFLCFLSFFSCNTIKEEDIWDEDYDSLFPFNGIDGPESERTDMTLQLCNPDMALENYKYPGIETPNGAEEYEVTLKCSFKERGNNIQSRYEVKFINEKKELITVYTQPAPSSRMNMEKGKNFTVKFTVYSGFPVYLCVTGLGPRESSVKASMEVISKDDLFSIPRMEVELFQNDEGIHRLDAPFCNYFILP